MPFFEGTCLTNTTYVIPFFFALIDNKKFDGFDWLFGCVEEARQQHEIQLPTVLITDDDTVMKSALEKHMPTVPQQLCVFYINGNIVLNIKRKWKKPVQLNEEASNEDLSNENLSNEYNEEGNEKVILNEANKVVIA